MSDLDKSWLAFRVSCKDCAECDSYCIPWDRFSDAEREELSVFLKDGTKRDTEGTHVIDKLVLRTMSTGDLALFHMDTDVLHIVRGECVGNITIVVEHCKK